MRARFDTKRKSIAPRNQARLEEFTPDRTDRFRSLSIHLLREIKVEIAGRRRKVVDAGEIPVTAGLYDGALACRVMQVVAHDLLLARAPRSENVINARLDWIRWRDGRATIVVPAPEVKMRGPADGDLVIPLGKEPSATLKVYLDMIRVKVLQKGDDTNPYLFPSPRVPGQPYGNLLQALCKTAHNRVGAGLTPHLYRHLMGWIWLREDPTALPQVQILLGHRSIATTMRYYAAIADEVALNLWQKFVTGKQDDGQ